MSSHRLVRNDHLLFIALISTLVIASPSISNYGYFGFTNVVYGQPDPNQVNSNTTNSVNLQNIPLKKVHVGDIDIAYKMFGKGDPIILIQGLGGSMNSWQPSTLRELASNHTVIIFDNRGVANTTIGTKQFSIQQFANDTVGLLDGLKIQKANVLGFSMGSFIAQQLAVTHPEKINRLILVGSSCGGKESIPQSPENLKVAKKLLSSIVNNTPIEPQEIKTALSWDVGPTWIKLHPSSLEAKFPTNPKDLVPSNIPLNAYIQHTNAVQKWKSNNWNGVCSQLTKISQPTLVVTGTEDGSIPGPANSIIIAGKIPGAWLVQIPAAGHSVMDLYPDKFNKILQTFLTTTS